MFSDISKRTWEPPPPRSFHSSNFKFFTSATKLVCQVRPEYQVPGLPKYSVLGVIAIAEDVGTIEYKIGVVNQVDHAGRAGDGKIAGGLAAVAVKMLVPGIQGRREKTEPSCHSKVCFGSPSFHTVVAPRPLTI